MNYNISLNQLKKMNEPIAIQNKFKHWYDNTEISIFKLVEDWGIEYFHWLFKYFPKYRTKYILSRAMKMGMDEYTTAWLLSDCVELDNDEITALLLKYAKDMSK